MTKEALKMALNALENNRQKHHYCEETWYSCPKHEDGCANEAEGAECNCGADEINAQFDKAITAIKEALAQPEQEPVAWMSEDERKAFERFNETCEDGEGYDVPKTMMRRLAEIGVIHHTSRGIYGITKFGRLLVGKTTQPQRKPMTYEEIEDLYFKFSMDELKDLPETLKPHTELRSKT